MIENIPAELRALDQWVTWRVETRDGKPTKVPYNPRTGARASTTNPDSWASFDFACGVAQQPGVAGVGFVFTDGDAYAGVDLDDCLDGGEMHPAAAEIVKELGGYAEVSPSKTGVKVFVRAELNGGRNRTSNTPWGGEIEMYDRARFFTVTGEVFGDYRTIGPGSELDSLRGRVFPATTPTAARQSLLVDSLSDGEVLDRARRAGNGDKFTRLWAGDASGHGGDDSRADMALMSMLWFWTQDRGQLKRLFRRSELGRRDKAGRDDYLERTIDAVAGGDTFSGGTVDAREHPPGGNGKPHLPFQSLAEFMAEVPDEPDWMIPGFIAPSTETLICGAPKVGKSTLLFRMLAALENGGRVLGLDVRRVSYLLCTEENAFTVQEKALDFDLRGRGGEVLAYPKVRGVTWLEVMQEAVARCREKGHELLVIDTFSRWAGLGGESENHAGSIQEAWKPFAVAREAGLATTVIHHTRKGGGKHGEGIRGSNAIAALPDILLELDRAGGEDATARVLNGTGRYRDTPDVLGLTFTGTDYEVTTDVGVLRGGTRAKVLELLAEASMTKAEVAEVVGITPHSIDVHLKRLLADDKIYRTGAGGGRDPYRYHLRTIGRAV